MEDIQPCTHILNECYVADRIKGRIKFPHLLMESFSIYDFALSVNPEQLTKRFSCIANAHSVHEQRLRKTRKEAVQI